MYNTGRPEADKYYLEETCDFRQLERRIKDLLSDYRHSNHSEMYIIHFNALRAFVELLRKNYDEEIKELNKFVRNFLNELVDKKPIIPEPILLNTISLEQSSNGEVIRSEIINLDITLARRNKDE